MEFGTNSHFKRDYFQNQEDVYHNFGSKKFSTLSGEDNIGIQITTLTYCIVFDGSV